MALAPTRVVLYALKDLLQRIDEGRIALPNFQRDFVWNEGHVRSLLASVFRGWPAGTFLMIEHDPVAFRPKPFDGGPNDVDPTRVDLLVLDGQQRLTALYHALYDKGPYVYAVDLRRALSDVDDIESFISSFKRERWDNMYRDSAHERLLMPLYELQSPFSFFPWVEEAVSLLPREEAPEVASALAHLFQHFMGGVEHYQFPCVVIDSAVEPAAIARIFETVNRSGLQLTSFDLVVARSFGDGWNLRDEWELARTNSRLIDGFIGEDGLPILRVIALRAANNVRQSAIINLERDVVREAWDDAVRAVNAALQFLLRECGVMRPDWLPYGALLTVLAAVAHDVELDDHANELRPWFFSNAFGLGFEVAANTAVVAEWDRLRHELTAGVDVSMPPISATVLLEATRQRRAAVWRSFLCALAYGGALDLSGEPLGVREAREAGEFLDDRVIPASVLTATHASADDYHRRVLGVVLALRPTASRLRKGEPLPMIVRDLVPPGHDPDTVLVSQFLPLLDQLETLHLRPEEFLIRRLELFAYFVEDVLGRQMHWDAGRLGA